MLTQLLESIPGSRGFHMPDPSGSLDDSKQTVTIADALTPRTAEDRKPFSADEDRLLEALLRGDESAFVELVNRYHATLVRLATAYVRDRAVAEEVAQDTWLAVLRGVHQFARRSSLKTWVFRILINTARHRAVRERRCIPFSAAWDAASGPFEPAVASQRFRGPAEQWPGGWISFPPSWEDAPEQRLLSREVRHQVQSAIDKLPLSQREVVLLRDVQGWTAAEVCVALQISESNQRVLLHRARSKVRQALEEYLTDY